MPRICIALLATCVACAAVADDAELAELRQQLARRDAQIAELKAQIAQLKAENQQLTELNARLSGEVRTQREEVIELKTDVVEKSDRIAKLETQTRELQVMSGTRSAKEKQALAARRVVTADDGRMVSQWAKVALIKGTRADHAFQLRSDGPAKHVDMIVKNNQASDSVQGDKAATFTVGEATFSVPITNVESERTRSGSSKRRRTLYAETVTLRVPMDTVRRIGEASEARLELGRATLGMDDDATALFRAFAARLGDNNDGSER